MKVQLGLEVATVRTAVRNIVTAKQALEDGTRRDGVSGRAD